MAKLTKAQADKIAELQATADGYRDMIANENDMAMCDKYFEIVEKCESQIAAIRKQAGQGDTMERQAIEIKYPNYAYELQVDQYGEFEYWDADNNVEAFYPYIRNKSGKIGYYNYAWRIVRTSDNAVIAQSKAPVATPDPVPTSEPTAQGLEHWIAAMESIDHDSEPLPVADAPVVAENATADAQPELCIWCGLHPQTENMLCANCQGNFDDYVAPQPVSGVQWLRREDLLTYEDVQFSFGVQRVSIPQPTRYFNERMGYTYLQDREETLQKPRSGVKRGSQGKRPMNMQKTADFKNTRRAMTSRQLGRMLKAEPISRKPKQRSALQVQRDLMFLNWIMGDRAA